MKHSIAGLYAHEILDSRRSKDGIANAVLVPTSAMFP